MFVSYIWNFCLIYEFSPRFLTEAQLRTKISRNLLYGFVFHLSSLHHFGCSKFRVELPIPVHQPPPPTTTFSFCTAAKRNSWSLFQQEQINLAVSSNKSSKAGSACHSLPLFCKSRVVYCNANRIFLFI